MSASSRRRTSGGIFESSARASALRLAAMSEKTRPFHASEAREWGGLRVMSGPAWRAKWRARAGRARVSDAKTRCAREGLERFPPGAKARRFLGGLMYGLKPVAFVGR